MDKDSATRQSTEIRYYDAFGPIVVTPAPDVEPCDEAMPDDAIADERDYVGSDEEAVGLGSFIDNLRAFLGKERTS